VKPDENPITPAVLRELAEDLGDKTVIDVAAHALLHACAFQWQALIDHGAEEWGERFEAAAIRPDPLTDEEEEIIDSIEGANRVFAPPAPEPAVGKADTDPRWGTAPLPADDEAGPSPETMTVNATGAALAAEQTALKKEGEALWYAAFPKGGTHVARFDSLARAARAMREKERHDLYMSNAALEVAHDTSEQLRTKLATAERERDDNAKARDTLMAKLIEVERETAKWRAAYESAEKSCTMWREDAESASAPALTLKDIQQGLDHASDGIQVHHGDLLDFLNKRLRPCARRW
jgi:hypothetical protein